MKRRRIVILLAFAVTVGAVWWIFRNQLTLDVMIAQEARLRQLVADYPLRSLILGFALYIAASLVPGTTGKSIVYGWLFGFWWALLIVNVALTVAAMISFLAIRYVFQEAVHRKLGSMIGHVDEALRRNGPSYLVTLRLVHAPYTLTNYVVGATFVRSHTFWWTTQLGLLPGNIVFVLAGAQLPSLQQLARSGPWTLINVPLLIALSLIALLPVAMRWFLSQLSDLRSRKQR